MGRATIDQSEERSALHVPVYGGIGGSFHVWTYLVRGSVPF